MSQRHGYFSETPYTFGAYPDFSPDRLAWVSLLNGHRPPRLDQPFRLLDLGCGQGFGLCLQAALYPQAQVLGVDFRPEHIAHGRSLAQAAGLANVEFLLADLLTLPQAPPPGWGRFDIVIAHGLFSWVSQPVQAALLHLAVQALRPGGLFYLSYNCLPGFLPLGPFQQAATALQRRLQDGNRSFDEAMELFEKLQGVGAQLFSQQPFLADQLTRLQLSERPYLLHEYLCEHWQALASSDVIDQASRCQLQFLGTAHFTDGVSGLLPDAFRALVEQQQHIGQRELVRDMLTHQAFRRDVYVNGLDPLSPGEAEACLCDQQLIALSSTAPQADGDALAVPLRWGTWRSPVGWVQACLDALQAGPRRIGDLLPVLLGDTPGDSLDAALPRLALLLETNLVALHPPSQDPAPAQRFNRFVAARVAAGAPYRHLAIPATGNLLGFDPVTLRLLDAIASGCPRNQLVSALRAARSPSAAPEPDDIEAKLQSVVARTLDHTLPLLQRLQAWP